MIKYKPFSKENKLTFQKCNVHFDNYVDCVTFYDMYNDSIELYGFISMTEVLVLLGMTNTEFEDLKDFSDDELYGNVIFTKQMKQKNVSIKTHKNRCLLPIAEWIIKMPEYEIIKD